MLPEVNLLDNVHLCVLAKAPRERNEMYKIYVDVYDDMVKLDPILANVKSFCQRVFEKIIFMIMSMMGSYFMPRSFPWLSRRSKQFCLHNKV